MNIVYITDEKYLKLTILSLISCYETNNQYNLHFYIFYNDLSDNAIQLLESIKLQNAQIEIIDINKYSFIHELNEKYKFKQFNNYISFTAHLRNYIPSILDVDRCLYLDCDTYIVNDISGYYNIDLDNKQIGVIKDFGMLTIWRDESKLSIRNNTHFYSGQILFNVKECNKTNFTQQYFTAMQKEFDNNNFVTDEELLNTIVDNSYITYAPIKYCVSHEKIIHYWKYKQYTDITLYNKIYCTSYKNINELVDDAAIYHYHGNKNDILKNSPCIRKLYEKMIYRLFDLTGVNFNYDMLLDTRDIRAIVEKMRNCIC